MERRANLRLLFGGRIVGGEVADIKDFPYQVRCQMYQCKKNYRDSIKFSGLDILLDPTIFWLNRTSFSRSSH